MKNGMFWYTPDDFLGFFSRVTCMACVCVWEEENLFLGDRDAMRMLIVITISP